MKEYTDEFMINFQTWCGEYAGQTTDCLIYGTREDTDEFWNELREEMKSSELLYHNFGESYGYSDFELTQEMIEEIEDCVEDLKTAYRNGEFD